MKRKILVTLLAFCLIASLCVVGAAAADGVECAEPECSHVAEANGLHYDSLKDAVAGAGSGNTITLLTDVEVDSTIYVGQGGSNNNVIINLDGNNITFAENKNFRIQAGALTLTGEGTVKEGAPYYSPLMVYGGLVNTPNYSVVNVGADVTVEGWAGVFIDQGSGLMMAKYARGVVINVDGTLNSVKDTSGAGGHGVYINGNIKDINANSPIINLGPTSKVTSIGNGIYAAGYAVWNLEGDVEGSDALSIKSGIFNISGGTYHATGEFADPAEANGNGSENTGAAVSITSNRGYAQNIEVNISGGEFKSDKGYALYEGIATKDNVPAADESTVKLNVEDGIFISNENKPAIAITEAADKKVVTGGTFISGSTASDVSAYFPDNTAMEVDKDTGKVVPSSDAVAEVGGDTVTLIDNVTADGAGKGNTQGVITIDKDITLDGNGNTLSVENVMPDASDATKRASVINIVSDAEVTVENLKIDASGAKHGLNINSGDVTVNNVTIENGMGYGIVCNSSTLDVNGLTTSNNGWGGINVDTNAGTGSTVTIANATVNELNSVYFENRQSQNITATINSGDFNAVTLGENVTASVTVNGGTFANSVAEFATTPDYELNSNGSFTYYDTLSAAQAAAKPGDTITFVGGDSTLETHTVKVVYDGNTTYTYELADGTSFALPTLEKSGYTFTGWRVNNSNTIVRGGESYKITADTTFTAVWNMIMIPDTYDIAVDQPAHGTVDVSFSNASQGSVITVTATPDEGYELVYITVDGEPISGNSFVMPDHAVEVSALFAEIGKEVNFVDVSRADWFYDYVQYVAQNGLMEGTTRTAFEPNASMTRAMFWTVLARIDGETITGDAWKTLAQTWAVESGISDGTNADALITREQMVTMLYRYAGSPVTGGMAISEFTDGASVSDYATDAVTWALSEGILTGMGDGILAPQGTATRAQAAAMLMRFVEA